MSQDFSQMMFASFDYSNVSRIQVLQTQSGEDGEQDFFLYEKVSCGFELLFLIKVFTK